MVSGILRCVVVLLLFALHIDSKAVSLLRQKRAPNFLQYPRQGRSNFFAYPRQGRSMPATLPKRENPDIVDSDDVCCPIGIKARWIVGEEPNFDQLLCKCCDGLTTRVLRQQMVAFAVCAPLEISENTDTDVSL